MLTLEERMHKLEIAFRDFRGDFGSSQIRGDKIFSEIAGIKERLEKIEKNLKISNE